MFSSNDLSQIRERGSEVDVVERQIERFKNGFPYLELVKSATINDGITRLSGEEVKALETAYAEVAGEKSILKFVPASGAASRMFKSLFTFVDDYQDNDAAYREFSEGKKFPDVYEFFKGITDFAFFDTLKDVYEKDGRSIEEDILKRKYKAVLNTLLAESGMGYGDLPKGLLEFHRYESETRTPAEEHLVEGALYCKGRGNEVHLHFTVSPEHREKFSSKIEQVRLAYEKRYGVTFIITFSEQKAYTDTIAVTMENEPFREDDGSLLFRPAGHGALIENLNEIDQDIIFVKNIDNVVPDRIKGDTVTYKKALAGLLIRTQTRAFEYLRKLENKSITDDELEEIFEFVNRDLCIQNLPEFHFTDEKVTFLRSKLNRPIRVCGMVKNEGEPGGGPFFARNSDGTISLQIAETSQIDPNAMGQQDILKKSTHFNPVDLVLGVKNYKGMKFDLTKFVDPDTGFISQKSKNGRDLKALELPGLWNGAMSDWNTIFVEVPVITFNPVKTVNDLLRPNHQPK